MAQEHQEYITTKVNPILENLVTQVLLERPENPVPFMVRWLATQSAQAKEYFAGAAVGEADKLRKEVQQLHEEVKELELKVGRAGQTEATDKSASASAPAASSSNKPREEEAKKEKNEKEDVKSDEEEAKEEKNEKADAKSEEDDEDDDEDDDDDEGEDAPPPPARYLQKGPRSSVSAEAYGQWNQKQEFTPPVHEKDPEQRGRIRKVLSQSFLFMALDQDSVDVLVDAMLEKNIPAGERVIQEKEDGCEMYIIESGTADCLKNIDGKEIVVKTCGAGDFFGELALLYNCPRAASVDAKTDLTLWRLDRATFNHIVRDGSMKKRQQYEEFFKSVPILKSLGDYERSQLADCLRKESVTAGTEVIQQGQDGDRFYIVEAGELAAQKNTGEGTTKEVMSYTTGNFFGELALLQNQTRQATIVAKTDSKLLWVDRRGFLAMLGPLKADMEKVAADYTP